LMISNCPDGNMCMMFVFWPLGYTGCLNFYV